MKKPVFYGAATAIVTPFCDRSLDLPAFSRLLLRQLQAGIRTIVVTGTTGEASTLTTDEKVLLWQLAVDTAGGKATVIAGIGTNNTAVRRAGKGGGAVRRRCAAGSHAVL